MIRTSTRSGLVTSHLRRRIPGFLPTARSIVALGVASVLMLSSARAEDPCILDPCDPACPPDHPCCSDPPDACCGSLDLCTTGTVIPYAETSCGPIEEATFSGFTFDLSNPIGPPEFPPPTLDPVKSTMPLISRSSARGRHRSAAATIPTDSNHVDLIFGRPLSRAVDFELPFGSAIFRHIRSFNRQTGLERDVDTGFWAWNGDHWMMAEAPIFLIDAQLRPYELPGPGGDQSPWVFPEPRCYLIPDAHHSIPFRLEAADPGARRYTAPPWFDAVLGYSSDAVVGASGEWITPPSEFYVWLDQQNIKYTFSAQYSDVRVEDHASPGEGGLGLPHYGLLTSVEDRQGNRLVIEYCNVLEFNEPCGVFYSPPYQTCSQKGQIKSLKLYASGATSAAWTLLYVHQDDGNVMAERLYECQHLYLGRDLGYFVRAILVYAGDRDTANLLHCLNLPAGSFDLVGVESLKAWEGISYAPAPADWIIKSEYTYARLNVLQSLISPDVTGESSLQGIHSAQLVRSVVTFRNAAGSDENARTVTTMYRYAGTETGATYVPLIKSLFETPAVDALLGAIRNARLHEDDCPEAVSDEFPDSDLLLSLHDDAPICTWDPSDQVYKNVPLKALATEMYDYWTYSEAERFGSLRDGRDPLYQDIADRFGKGLSCYEEMCSVDDTMPYGRGSLKRHFAHTGDPGRDGEYRYFFLRLSLNDRQGCYWIPNSAGHTWEGHIPYYDQRCREGAQIPLVPSGAEVRHVAIVDRVLPDTPEYWEVDSADYPGLLERRVVEMSAQGFILRDRTFSYADNAAGEQIATIGYAASEVRNEFGRLIEKRTAGWNADENVEGVATNGLIRFFEYTDGGKGELAREGIMIGTAGERWYTAVYEHDIEDRPELVTTTVHLTVPVSSSGLASLDYSAHEVTKSFYTLGGQASYIPGIGLSGADRPVTYEAHIAKLGPLPGSANAWIWGIARKQYDDSGQLTWSGIGRFSTTASDPGDPADEDLLEFYVDLRDYNNDGQISRAIVDTDTTGPAGFVRLAPEALPPLNLTTTYTYDSYGRPLRINKPGGMSDRTVYDHVNTDGLFETWQFTDVAANGDVDKPVTVIQTNYQGILAGVLTVHVVNYSDRPTCDDSCQVLSRAEMEYDEYGRPVGIKAMPDADTNSGAVQSTIAYDAFGQIGRERSPDGTVTRTTRGARGRVDRIFRGTKDKHLYWRTATPEEEPDDDMVLVEKHFYGEGIRDAGLVREVRRYNQKPINQYYEEGEEPGDIPPNDENSNGLRTVYRYDCRMRPVLVEEQDATGVPLYRTFTWYDQLDRPRLTADYSGDAAPPAVLDPRLVCFFDGSGEYPSDPVDGAPASPDVPWARSIRDASPAPISLAETLYNPAGQVAEERDYVIDPPGEPLHFSATYYEFDGRGLTLAQSSPGGGTSESLYNALGQLVLQRKVVPSALAEAGEIEVRRTHNAYDPFGNLIVEKTYERAYGAGVDASFDDPEDDAAVVQYRHYWYDSSNRLIATADYGTNHASDLFVTGPEPTRGAMPPQSGPALVTRYDYDSAGRQSLITDPGGIVTFTEFDDLGRQLLVTENATAIDGGPRHTAYRYATGTGQLIEVAAINGQDVEDYDDVDWTATDGSIQITRYAYNAPIVNLDSTGALVYVSTNGGWISAVHYPDPATGQPEVEPSLRFAYRHDGQVAQRIDGRGVELDYHYDARDRLESIEVASFGADVSTNAQKFEYAYTPSGQLTDAYVRDPAGIVLNHIHLTYGASNQVATVSQQIGAGSPLTTTFDWEWSEAAGETRLTGMIYPHAGAPTLEYAYGGAYTSSEISDALSRLTELDIDGNWYALWHYMGDSRIVAQSIGGHARGLQLDRFGRTRQIAYTNASGTALQHAYGYDARGNRTFNYTNNGGTTRSWRYTYDGLSRLASAAQGGMTIDGNFIAGTQPDTTTWLLDDLGNWSGDDEDGSVHHFRDTNADGDFDVGEYSFGLTHHDVTAANEIENVVTTAPGEDPVEVAFKYDPAGNLIFDGQRYFTYDPWNRLATIHEPGTLAIVDGELVGQPGDCIERFQYDALGRRVITWLAPDTEDEVITHHVYGTGAAVLEEYEYVPTGDPQQPLDGGLARWFIHGESFPDPLYLIDTSDAGDEGAGVEEWLYYLKDALGSTMALVSLDTGAVVERYAYDPYGATKVLSRFAVEYAGGPVDPTGSYYYHDSDFDEDVDADDLADLLACVGASDPRCVFFHDRNGDGTVTSSDVSLMLTTYGGVGAADQPPPAGHVRFAPELDLAPAGGGLAVSDAGGLQACFASTDGWCTALYDADTNGVVDLSDAARFSAYAALAQAPQALAQTTLAQASLTGTLAGLTAPLAAPPAGGDQPPPDLTPLQSRFRNPFLWTGQRYDPATQLYHFWARSYDPNTGRFLQEDMQGVLSPFQVYHGTHSDAPRVVVTSSVSANEYLAGLALYLYLASNPTANIDPFGLYEDEIDDMIADVTGQRLYTLGALNEGAKWAALGLQSALGIAKFLLPGSGLYDAFQSVQAIASGRGGFWDAVNIATAALPLVKGAALGFKALGKARKFARRACNCFVAGTQVSTDRGPVPIEDLALGDIVLTRSEDDPCATPTLGSITKIIHSVSPSVITLSFSDGTILGLTPRHEVWTSEHGWTCADRLRVGEHFASLSGSDISIVDIQSENKLTLVYNLEIDGTFTYFANGFWVHNNSCARVIQEAHHALPKFLDGLESGLTVVLDRAVHQQYHGGLYAALYDAGIRKPRNMKWMDYFGNHMDQYDDALNALMDYTRRFDEKNGTGIIHVLWSQIKNQWW